MLKSLIKNPLSIWAKWVLTKFYYELKYSEKHLSIGYMVRLNNVKFGTYNSLFNDVALQNVELGDFSYIAQSTRIVNAKIGKFSSIGPEAMIGLGIHPARDFVSAHPIFYSSYSQTQLQFTTEQYFIENKKIFIGNDVWIGARVIILDGVTIGDGAIVGAGAIVTKDIPSYAVVAGSPAKVLRYRFDVEDIEFLIEYQWWNKDVEWLKINFKKFHDIKKFKKHVNI